MSTRSARRPSSPTDPRTSDDPQPGDLDAVLATIDPMYVTHHEGRPGVKLRVLVSVEGDIRRLERIAAQLL